MPMLKNFIKRVWLNKFAILDFLFTWIIPITYVGTKVQYIQINIAWKITIFGFLALFVLLLAFRKKIRDYLLRKTGYKNLRDYAVRRPFGFIRGLLLVIIKHWKQAILLGVLYLLQQFSQNSVELWLVIIGLTTIGSLFCFIHNIARKEKAVVIDETEQIS